jgi:DNA helicase-2/ATP-dependent DNA helicase PcrA
MEDALRKRDIPYRIWWIVFYQRKEIKDVLCYLRLVINPKDEEALMSNQLSGSGYRKYYD